MLNTEGSSEPAKVARGTNANDARSAAALSNVVTSRVLRMECFTFPPVLYSLAECFAAVMRFGLRFADFGSKANERTLHRADGALQRLDPQHRHYRSARKGLQLPDRRRFPRQHEAISSEFQAGHFLDRLPIGRLSYFPPIADDFQTPVWGKSSQVEGRYPRLNRALAGG